MSKKNDTYRQCKLVKQTDTGTLVDVAWIPARFAKVGRQLQLRKEQGNGCVVGYTEWDGGWVVDEVWGTMIVADLDRQREAQRRWERTLADH